MVVDGHDSDDHWRSLQLCSLHVRRRYSGDSSGRSFGRCHNNIECHLPEREIELRRKDVLRPRNSGFRHHRAECTRTECGLGYPVYAKVRDLTRILELYWSSHTWMRLHCYLGGATLWKEDYDGLHLHLQLDRRLECCCYPRARCCNHCSNQRQGAIQQVVHLCTACFRSVHAANRNYLPQRKFSWIETVGKR